MFYYEVLCFNEQLKVGLYWVIKVLRTQEALILLLDLQTAVTVKAIMNWNVPAEWKDSILHNLLNSYLHKFAEQLLSRRSPAPGEVTGLSPCSCWCLAPHASQIPSPHLLHTRCSWIISQTGESLLPLQLNLDLCYISSNSGTSRHVQAIFAQVLL